MLCVDRTVVNGTNNWPDLSSANNTLALSGLTTGVPGQGVQFLGGYASLATYNRPLQTSFTVSLWLFPNSTVNTQTLFSVTRAPAVTNGEGALSIQGWYDYSGGYGFNDPAAVNISVPQNQWVHYVFVRLGLTGSYYINGELRNTTTASTNISYTNSHLTLGGDYALTNSGFCTSLAGCFTGVIGQAVVLNKALVSAEVKTLFLATAANFLSGPAPSPSPVLSTPAIIGIATGGAAGVAVLVAVVTVAALYYKGPPRIQDALHKAFKRKPKKEKVQTKKEVDTRGVPAHTDTIKLDIK